MDKPVKHTLVYNGSHVVHFIKQNRDIQIFTSVELEAANHRGGKREKKNIQGGERGGGWGIEFTEASLELQPSVGAL